MNMLNLKTGGVVVILLVLAGCKPQQTTTESAESLAKPQTVSSEHLPPVFASAKECLNACRSQWSAGSPWREVPKPPPPAPIEFLEFLAAPEELERFAKLLSNLPQPFQPAGKPQWGENRKTFEYPMSGAEKDRPLIFFSGALANVIETRGKALYVYSDIMARSASDIEVELAVVVDPATQDRAALLKVTGNGERQYLIGSAALQGPLLAYAVAADIETADSKARQDQQIRDLGRQDIVFPLQRNKDDAAARLQVLSGRFEPPRVSWRPVGLSQAATMED